MKQREFTKCIGCGKGMMHSNVLNFYRVKIESMLINPNAVNRQAGLERFMGSGVLAAVMGPDEDLAVPVTEVSGLLCFQCAADTSVIHVVEKSALFPKVTVPPS